MSKTGCILLFLLAVASIASGQTYQVVLNAMMSDGSRQIVQQSRDDQRVTMRVIWNGEELIWTQFEEWMLDCIVKPWRGSLTTEMERDNATRFDVFPWIPKYQGHSFLRAAELFEFCHTKVVKDDHPRRVRRSNPLFIMPETKWCGKGNVALSKTDQGSSVEADQCCRKHDQCQETIQGMKTYKDFKNWLPYTLSSCTCDDEFYMCLKRANNIRATQVGRAFFNILKVKCFLVETRQKQCMSWTWGIYCNTYGPKNVVIVYDPQEF